METLQLTLVLILQFKEPSDKKLMKNKTQVKLKYDLQEKPKFKNISTKSVGKLLKDSNFIRKSDNKSKLFKVDISDDKNKNYVNKNKITQHVKIIKKYQENSILNLELIQKSKESV